ncbi:MAG: acyl--CoA ligase [Deltaproteobacteria bacterium]|nr:acyl--CoA ligase [Deltaproteobacteria bacterium]
MDYIEQNHTLIHHFLEQSAEAYPDKIALIQEDVRATYAEINTKANQIAHWLINQGVQSGDRVVLLLENSLEYVIGYYGALKASAVVAPLSTDLKPDGLNPLLAELEPKAIISSSRFERLLKATDLSIPGLDRIVISKPKLAWDSMGLKALSFEELVTSNSVDFTLNLAPCALRPALCALHLASIIYTSGSTGKPKGVMLSHRNIVSNTHSISQSLQLESRDIQMIVLPFFYVMGKSLLNTNFAVGGTVVLNNKFAYPATVVKQMSEERVTGFSGVPSTYAYLLHRSPLKDYRDKLDSLRYCSQAGGHMSRNVKEDLRKVLPEHTQIYIMYGATEASARLTCLEPERFLDKMESIGKPIPGVTLQIFDNSGNAVSMGKTGEIVASGSNIMQGYWKDKESTKKVLDRHGYHTGDLGYEDEGGYFFVIGRSDNLIKVGGHRINTQEVEDALMETDRIVETVVLGIPDPLLGYRLVALVCTKNGDYDEKETLSHCASRLPKYKMPSEIKLVRTLPKSSSGKIDRNKCLQIATG